MAEENKFNGTIRYTVSIEDIEKEKEALIIFKSQFDCVDLIVNGECQNRLCGSPYRGWICLRPGQNIVEILFPLTPVFSQGDCWSSLTVLPSIGLLEEPDIYIKEGD